MDDRKIRLGAQVPPAAPSGPAIQLGRENKPGDAPASPAPPGETTPEQRESGFSSEKGRRMEAVFRHAKEKAKEPAVKPSILILTGAACFVLLILMISGGGGGSPVGFENNALVLQEYASYQSSHPQLPPPAAVADRLNGIVLLENRGDKEKAIHAWQEVMLETETDKANPLYQMAVTRLKALR
jgi:hypothetical protein